MGTIENSAAGSLMSGLSGLMEFLKNSPTAFHAVENIRIRLETEGFERLTEADAWNITPGGKYYTVRGGSSIIAFRVGEKFAGGGFMIAASHSDSPCFKLKPNCELNVKGQYVQLNTEGYGGMICSSWMDRPLSVAGRLLVRKTGRGVTEFESRLVDLGRDLVLIPNLAIHMNRRVNDSQSYNKQTDMLPLFSCGNTDSGELLRMAAELAGAEPQDVLGSDLCLYNRTEPTVWGAGNEFISSGRLDDLECAFCSLEGFLAGRNEKTIQVFCCFDNEEVGSHTKQGAVSTFLPDVLRRAASALGADGEEFRRMAAGSFMLSCDNAHAVHPNHPEKTDTKNCVYMNGGVVIKYNSAQKYTTDGVSMAVFRELCGRAGVPVQYFANRSDEPGGSTLGNLAMAQFSVNTVDIGLAQLAMHSAYETAGAEDPGYMTAACREFFSARVFAARDGSIALED